MLLGNLEIIDVVTLLNNMGSPYSGSRDDIIIIDGVPICMEPGHQVIPDRTEAGTYCPAAAIGEGIQINNVLYEHLESHIKLLEEMV